MVQGAVPKKKNVSKTFLTKKNIKKIQVLQRETYHVEVSEILSTGTYKKKIKNVRNVLLNKFKKN
jgi:hypothetical protein